MRFSTDSQATLAGQDIGQAVRHPQLWLMLGWQDIKQRYRRSVIGPFWLTLSTAVMVVGLGLLYAAIFRQSLREYFPYLATGLIIWSFLSAVVADGCQAFIASEGIIKQMRVPFCTHALRVIWRNIIILGHNAVIIVVVIAVFGTRSTIASMPFFIPAMLLLLLNVSWVVLILGTICARFRDVPLIVANAMQLLFFLTPIIWQPSLLPGRQRLVFWNPLYHFVEVVRAPLLGQVPAGVTWLIVSALAVGGWAFTFFLFQRFRRRIAYWL
jgi:ABC-type polysaccharide/polyol phosphate export permease